MIKHFCDLCEKEVSEDEIRNITINVAMHVCSECKGKIEVFAKGLRNES